VPLQKNMYTEIDIKYPEELTKPKEFPKELLESLLAEGFATEQKINGEVFIKMTSQYFDELGDYIRNHPKELCVDYWNKIVQSTTNYDILTFIKIFCVTHKLIKEITNSEVDFTEQIGEEL
jgi:hypothetical protein